MAEAMFGVSRAMLLVQPSRTGAAKCSEPRSLSPSLILQSGGARSRHLGFTPSSPINSICRFRYSSDSKFFRGVVSFSKATEEIKVPTDGGDGGGGSSGGSGRGGGGGDNEGKSEEGSDEKRPKMSMSQKLTLGYAALVGAGGVIGYLKSGSQKSLMAGGFSALLLYIVYTLLPSRPAMASALGLGLSAALLGIMGSRFVKSRKVIPAGVVSLTSLVMTGGYLHGILRSMH